MLPLISTSVLSTLRPLGPEVELGREESAGLLAGGEEGGVLAEVSLLDGPVDEMPDSYFCPITF